MMLATITDAHRKIEETAAKLITLLEQPTMPDADTLAPARWAFASAMFQHLALKERHIYARLERHERQDVRAYFASSKADLQQRLAAYTSHMTKWPTSGAGLDWQSYRVSALNVVRLFLARLADEERDLLPYVQSIALDISMPCGATTNWTRDAFQIKENIDSR